MNTPTMETKHRTLIQASVLLILLVCAAMTNGSSEPSQATAQVITCD